MRYSYRCEVGQITAVERAVARDLEGSQTEGRGGSTLLNAVHIRPHRFTTQVLQILLRLAEEQLNWTVVREVSTDEAA